MSSRVASSAQTDSGSAAVDACGWPARASATSRSFDGVIALVLRVLPERFGQLRASGDVEFSVGATEVHFDGLDGQVQLRGDLAVAEARGGVLGDAQFRRGERVAVVEIRGPESYAGGRELAVCSLRERAGSPALREPQSGLE